MRRNGLLRFARNDDASTRADQRVTSSRSNKKSTQRSASPRSPLSLSPS